MVGGSRSVVKVRGSSQGRFGVQVGGQGCGQDRGSRSEVKVVVKVRVMIGGHKVVGQGQGQGCGVKVRVMICCHKVGGVKVIG